MSQFPPSYLRNECQGLDRSWTDDLYELKGITYPESVELKIDNIRELYAKAKVIKSTVTDPLDHQAKALLSHITSQPFDGHVAIAKGSENLVKLF